jgi:multidrug efflux pump subunit AcrA (membrane-fusion protein)
LIPPPNGDESLSGSLSGSLCSWLGSRGWLYSRTYESTDDAQINGHLNAIASRVAGTVKAVYVENDQPVKAGQPLVDLDPKDYEVLVEQARAGYEQAIAQAAAESPNVPHHGDFEPSDGRYGHGASSQCGGGYRQRSTRLRQQCRETASG